MENSQRPTDPRARRDAAGMGVPISGRPSSHPCPSEIASIRPAMAQAGSARHHLCHAHAYRDARRCIPVRSRSREFHLRPRPRMAMPSDGHLAVAPQRLRCDAGQDVD